VYEIPKPALLDADRVDRDDREEFTLNDHRSQSQLLAKALGESCAYADQLWNQVNALRGYLLDSLPPDPRTPRPHTTAAASPTGPDDEGGWQHWIEAFATTTSVLCGSHGDSGFGLSRARQEAQLRRTAPELALHAQRLDRERAQQTAPSADPSPTHSSTPPVAAARAHETPIVNAPAVIKGAAAAVVGLLAIRGLRNPAPRA
jgi:hypothetical protein